MDIAAELAGSGLNLNLTAAERAEVQNKVAIGVLFGLAVIAFISRILLRLITRRRLFLDDAFLTLAWACLCVGTGIMYHRVGIVYLEFAVLGGDTAAYALIIPQINALVAQATWQLAYLVMLWTTVFAVKWCYLIFFFPLLRNMSRWFIWYYRAAVVFSVACWILILVGDQVLSCPYLGEEAGGMYISTTMRNEVSNTGLEKCFPKLPVSHTALMTTFWAFPILDAATDIIIVSIPLVLLRQVRMDLMTKIGVSCFVCLSVFMCACAITRAAGTYYQGALNYPWQDFWLHAEGCIAVMMASITAYRSTLIGSNDVSHRFRIYLDKIKHPFSWRQRASAENTNTGGEPKTQTNRFNLPRIPNATMTGLRTWFGAKTAQGTVPLASQASTIGEEFSDYHAFLKPKHSAGMYFV
ncbi:hypothetical protein N7466_011542 [Penicillium verhagenii]|uniref:uncharacterized protein n=1 Tax=Penicillium verhagenii TaxID=1562060 RepID=UPI002545A602|nr:uncharacterized protein N7466_011542 [Penicillium verhagenii]KAJ5915609.1 hypothetical protein N7466_011542 [Penicillium verhagenii]